MADDAREKLAAALPESLGPVGLRRRAIPALGVEASVTGYGVMLLDALLPVVDEIAGKRAAEAEAQVQRVEALAKVLITAPGQGPIAAAMIYGALAGGDEQAFAEYERQALDPEPEPVPDG